MSDISSEFDLDPKVGASSGNASPQTTPVFGLTFKLTVKVCRTIITTTACGSTQTSGRC
ncbi:FDLD family class I lanthipeptide [Clavibacter sepedonicus]|uniref:Uncharacterized protein n=2 Tax=Clavibacter TaxID=1573 RepID=A0AAE6XTH7_9MICO|nr:MULTISPECIES: FDLD family class I lanthipeptide [Clavibacter]MBD5382564.1 hypothetical protein [Clavibacter sp.]QIS40510.1 hypothetical protein GW572_15100 [Clavibacter capsici]QIS43559.1 hypothetical protein GW571_15120 [Clavibacter capsici]QIS46504.1 hypothetical protein GW570_15110 [Clavibacter capsici]UUK67351.1 FDLD family class I lanthipeptide [Clavibacter sepedonicus]